MRGSLSLPVLAGAALFLAIASAGAKPKPLTITSSLDGSRRSPIAFSGSPWTRLR
jgi:hypothetical protein